MTENSGSSSFLICPKHDYIYAEQLLQYHNSKHFQRQQAVLHSLAIAVVGRGRCAITGCANWKKLHLHHIRYVKGESYHNGWQLETWLERVYEAIQHPERFIVLCKQHHDELDPGRRKFLGQRTSLNSLDI